MPDKARTRNRTRKPTRYTVWLKTTDPDGRRRLEEVKTVEARTPTKAIGLATGAISDGYIAIPHRYG